MKYVELPFTSNDIQKTFLYQKMFNISNNPSILRHSTYWNSSDIYRIMLILIILSFWRSKFTSDSLQQFVDKVSPNKNQIVFSKLYNTKTIKILQI